MENYKKLVTYGMKLHNEVVETERCELPLIYFGAIIASMTGLHIYDEQSDELIKPNIYCMNFLPSGAGKDYAKNIYSKLFDDILRKHSTIVSMLVTETTRTGVRATKFPSKYDKKIHKDYGFSICSSEIGIYIQALAIECAKRCSRNIEINEFADHLGKSENINLLKELYDGEMKAKLIQGNEDDEARQSIEDLWANMLAYGTPSPIKEDKQKMKLFKELTTSGMFRRSLVYYSEPKSYKMQEREAVDVEEIITCIKEKLKRWIPFDEKTRRFTRTGELFIAVFDSNAEDMLKRIAEELHNKSSKNPYDELSAYDKFNSQLIRKIATIVSFLDCSDVVTYKHVEYAYGLFNRTRNTVTSLLEETPTFERIYKLLSVFDNPIEKTQIMKKLGTNSKEFDDSIPLVNEYAYGFNKMLETEGNHIKKYQLKSLPMTDLKKIKVSIGVDKKREASINFKATEIPFIGEFSIEKLVISKEYDCFCTAHFNPSNKAPEGHRGEDYFIEGQNLVAFDFDSGITLEEVKDKFYGLTYLIYTTKSHRKDGKGDRFRLLLPTEREFFVTPEQHKQMYENIADAFGIMAYDKATRNVSRLWFTNPSAEIYINNVKDCSLLDVISFLPQSIGTEKYNQVITKAVDGENDVRVKGFLKWFFSSTSEGNRNNNLFRFKKYLDDIEVEAEPIIRKYNAMLDTPIKESELKHILR